MKWITEKKKLLVLTLIVLALSAFALAQANQNKFGAQPNATPAASPSPIPENALKMTITRSDSPGAQKAPAENFTGSVTLLPVIKETAPSRVSGGRVTFEPGARSNWHTHPFGQTLIVISGSGRVQQWGAPVQEMRAGDVIWTPPGVKHWHGAAPGNSMTHIAIQESQEGKNVNWLEKVTDEQYNGR